MLENRGLTDSNDLARFVKPDFENGFHDPFFKGLVDHEEQPGPILSLLSSRSFDHVFLFDTPGTQKLTEETRDAISNFHRDCKVHVLDINRRF